MGRTTKVPIGMFSGLGSHNPSCALRSRGNGMDQDILLPPTAPSSPTSSVKAASSVLPLAGTRGKREGITGSPAPYTRFGGQPSNPGDPTSSCLSRAKGTRKCRDEASWTWWSWPQGEEGLGDSTGFPLPRTCASSSAALGTPSASGGLGGGT